MKHHLILLCFLLEALLLTAQEKGMLKGRLADSANGQPLMLATITVFKAKDTSIVTYRLSNDKGEFSVPGLPLDIPLRAVITFSGYNSIRKEFLLSADHPQHDAGKLLLSNHTGELEEVLVIAERPPVVFKKDTIEFNAEAFKTLPTALVEDLLKKLPGVEVDSDGSIKVNGKSVSRILVDGKDFFGGDPKIATRNLPSNVIDKVQVSDDKTELRRNPNLNPADLGQVINLKLKKNIKRGWFGKMYAGGGTDERYETGGIVNLFRDTLQVSVLGYTNNINKPAFGMSDIQQLGGFGRKGIKSMMSMSDGGFEIDGISFGGMGQGILRSTGGGFNANTELNKKTSFNLLYFYGHANSQLSSQENTLQFINDTAFNTRNNTSREEDSYKHRVGSRVRWRPDSLSTFEIEPQLSFNNQRSRRLFTSIGSSNYEPLLNKSDNRETFSQNNTGVSVGAYFDREFKSGGSIYIANDFTSNTAQSNQYNQVVNNFYDPVPSQSGIDQLRDKDQGELQNSMSIFFSKPLSKKTSMRVGYTGNFFKDNDIVNTFRLNTATEQYDLPDASLSNGIRRSGMKNSVSGSLEWEIKKWSVSPGVHFQQLYIKNDFVKDDEILQKFFFILPVFRLSKGNLSLDYHVQITQPDAGDLQPITDNTNPLYLVLGNPALKPTRYSYLSANYRYNNLKNQTNFYTYINFTTTRDKIIRERLVDAKGIQVSRPVNVNGAWNAYFNFSGGKQFRSGQHTKLTLRVNSFSSIDNTIILVNNISDHAITTRINPSLTCMFNWKDIIEINERYGPQWNKTSYDNDAFKSLSATVHTSTTEIVVRYPRRWVWESTVDYMYNSQMAEGFRKSSMRWNAGINFLFLKQDKGALKLSAYDLLNQNINVQRFVMENYITDSQSTVLQRYFMLTFTYNIRSFGDQKAKDRSRSFFFY